MKPLFQNLYFTTLFIIIAVGFISCDYIDPPYGQDVVTVVTKRKVLLEDFTGHTCPNCPDAAHVADTITNYLFKDQVVVMALHVGSFATTYPGLFSYDFKTTEGTTLDGFFGLSTAGLPKGMVNRAGYPGLTHKRNFSSWINDVYTELSKPAEAEITITNSYDQINKIVSTSVKSKFLADKTGKYFLSVFYVEDSIIQPQLFHTAVDSNFVFMHTLRGSFNGAWGEQIALNPATDEEVTKQYSAALKSDAVPKNCRVVAFVYDDDTKEIVQADEKQIQ